MAPLFRADQVGSLIRPDFLLEDRASLGFYADKLSADQAVATSAAVAHAAQKQLDLDIRPITSGEYERTIFFGGFFENLEGMEVRQDLRIPQDFRPDLPNVTGLAKMGLKHFAAVVATGKIKHVSSAYLPAWEMIKKTVPEEYWKDCKMSIPSITWQHMYLAKGTAFTPGTYASDQDYFLDLAAAFRAELKALYDAGLRSVQVDDPNLTFFIVEQFREGLRGDGIDPDSLMELYIWAHNQALEGLPLDMHVGIHLCRGNMPDGPSFAEGSYEKIARHVFPKLNYATFYLEFDDPRISGHFEPLRFVPQGKNVVLGLVSTKIAELEDKEALVQRIHEAAEAMAKGQGRAVSDVLADSLAVSPQCGFASHSINKGVATEERMWEKLVLVRDVARSVWKDAI
ncbi:Putative cobalamin-independent methionine synthase MetE/archaeal, UROD/MetE-like superfamily [Colletotrichum destructivum]|uniref:Cobalamin-independent methionine synthase MetE/archaeal, UROD/MetE-like superfamily n=1 Tax=Colletotrichum destructivum TaxID=34406 RepID=A0AAX4IQV9_9PEZI|nr:Putative cobalamin-independent methionine synthase MetE/archaeal, UROD/MetE-like superfamily [Colletotrichum destructivum]